MKILVIGTVVFLSFFMVIPGGIYWFCHNGLVKKEVQCDKAWAEVENMIKRRADLIPNYVATVKGYAKHEKDVFTNIADARAKLGQVKGVKETGLANSMLSGALSKLLVVVERYPDLKANGNFLRLQDELTGTENRIAVARTRYNEAVTQFNTGIRKIPASIVASTMDLEKREFFEITNEQDKVLPKVDFN